MAASELYERGRRILPVVLDQLASDNSQRLYASIPKGKNIADGFQEITVGDVANAVHSMAYWVHDTVGRGQHFETLAYVGINDLRYAVFWFAAIKCGYKALFLSPRNTLNQNLSLMQQTQCAKFFFSAEFSALAEHLKESLVTRLNLDTYVVSPFDEWVSASTKSYEYIKSFEEAIDDPIIVLHSSGSTGDPKPITNTNGFFAMADRPLPVCEGREHGGIALLDYEGGGSYFSPFPGFHLAGITALAFFPVMMKSASTILGLPDRPPSIDMVHEILQEKKPRVLYLPPSIIEALSKIPSALDMMKQAESVVFAGGPLSQPIGDMLSHHVKLSSSYGSTEIGNVPCLLPRSREDWEWLCWHPSVRADMVPAVDGAFEFVFNRDKDADNYRAISTTILRHQPQYRSRDLFMSHPSKPGMWRFYSRSDDIIVFSNGEKWNPIPTEALIQTNPKLTGALVIGNGKFQPAVLLEPKAMPDDDQLLIEEVWPLIVEANSNTQKFGRIARSMVTVAPVGSFTRAPKGTVVRKLTLEKLASLAEALYTEHRDLQNISNDVSIEAIPAAAASEEVFINYVRACVDLMPILSSVTDNEDFYVKGSDSLETLELCRLLKRGLLQKLSASQLAFLTPAIIFKNPAVQSLGIAIYQGVNNIQNIHAASTKTQIHSLIESYTFDTQPMKLTELTQDSQSLCIVLTGSTGFLGYHLLRALLSTLTISQVICLDRSPESARSRAGSLGEHLLAKASFLQADFSSPDFDLSENAMRKVEKADLFIHNAWRVDFNLTLGSFETLIAGTSRIARWATNRSERIMRMVFISSVAVASHLQASTVPEELLYDLAEPPSTGYGQSKMVVEEILGRICHKSKLPVTILRIGQIAGSVEEDAMASTAYKALNSRPWNQHEWVPALIKSSLYLGYIPAELPVPVDWIPANLMAQVITELVIQKFPRSVKEPQDVPLRVYNLVNPFVTSWSSLVPTVQEYLPERGQAADASVKIVPYSEWFLVLKKLAERTLTQNMNEDFVKSTNITELCPGLKLIDFYEELNHLELADQKIRPHFVTTKTTEDSTTLEHLSPILPQWMSTWMRQWPL